MISKRFVISNERGIHLRPAMAMVDAAEAAQCGVIVRRWGETFGACSLLRFLAAQIAEGEEIEIICDGDGEEDAMAVFSELIESGFREILTQEDL